MRLFLLITTLVALSLQAYAKKIPGTIVSKGMSRDVTFDIKVPWLDNEPNFVRIQYRVKYFDENGRKQILRPEDADEISFEFDGMHVRMVSCENTIGGANMIFSASPKIFLKLEIDGPLRLYRYYYKQTTGGSPGYATMTYTVENFIFQKGKGPLKQPRLLGWRKNMLEYFRDCPALHERIENKDLKRKEIEAIVMYYNANCVGKDEK